MSCSDLRVLRGQALTRPASLLARVPDSYRGRDQPPFREPEWTAKLEKLETRVNTQGSEALAPFCIQAF